MIEVIDGVQRFVHRYKAYPHQKAFHESKAPHRLLGGAAGPGKTLALIQDHMLSCNLFNAQEAPEVHTLILRRTYPKLEDTVITRFREKIPRELYQEYNEQKHVVTWHNGATTKFGAMQYEHDVWGYQGQWFKIGYDELTEFTFPQWQNISAWNRCPVSKRCTKDGATNPIGIGARWVEDLFVKHQPCVEMDQGQKEQYNPENYKYFQATYLDNPVYANDPNYIRNLDSYPLAISRALKLAQWGIAGGYFEGAWDEAYNVYPALSVRFQKWWKRWLGGDWGFDHNFSINWFVQDDAGIVRIYRELVDNKHTPEELAQRIIEESEQDGDIRYDLFSFSHDAFASHRLGQSVNSIALRMGEILQRAGLPFPQESTRDKVGREQILYDFLKGRVKIGEVFNDADKRSDPIVAARLQIADCCPNLIRTIQVAPRDEKKSEEIAEFLGDDPLQSAGYGLMAMFGGPNAKPVGVQIEEQITEWKQKGQLSDPTQEMMWRKTLELRAQKKQGGNRFAYRGRR